MVTWYTYRNRYIGPNRRGLVKTNPLFLFFTKFLFYKIFVWVQKRETVTIRLPVNSDEGKYPQGTLTCKYLLLLHSSYHYVSLNYLQHGQVCSYQDLQVFVAFSNGDVRQPRRREGILCYLQA